MQDSEDPDTISELTGRTSQRFDHEKLRLLYVAAQVARVDLKIDLAVDVTMRIYRRALRTASLAGMAPLASTATRVSTSAAIVKEIVACFGVPSVSPETIMNIMKSVVWDDIAHNLSIFVAECIAGAGVFGTVMFGGMPFVLAAGAVNVPIVVPATTRLTLMIACDVMLILTMAFKEATEKCIGQPLKKDVENAALSYRQSGNTALVHKRIKKLVPRRNVAKSFRTERIRKHMASLVDEYKDKVIKDLKENVKRKVVFEDVSDSDDATVTERDQSKESWEK
jgi:hypothetical protein